MTTTEKMTKEELIAKLQVILTKMNETEDDGKLFGPVHVLHEEAQELIDEYFTGIGWSCANFCGDETVYVDWKNGKELREFDDYYDEDDSDEDRARKVENEEDTVLDGIFTNLDMDYFGYYESLEAVIETIDKWEVETFYAVWTNGGYWGTKVYTADDYDRWYDSY